MFKGRFWLTLIYAAGLAAVSSVALYLAAGPGLNFFLVSVLFAAILTPPLSVQGLEEAGLAGALLIALCVTTVFSAGWLAALFAHQIDVGAWMSCTMVLLAFALSAAGVTAALTRARVNPVVASAITTICGLLWLTWPVWLSHHLSSVHWLVTLHPLLAVNGRLADLGFWGEQRIAYSLTTLGQDLPLSLPASAWPAEGFHTGIAALAVGLCSLRRSKPQ